MPDEDSDTLQQTAAETDPRMPVEDKARRLIPELERYVEETEAKDGGDDDGAPEHASAGVGEHERDMQQRGFHQAGPPAG